MAFTDQGAYLDTSERVQIGGTGDPVVSLKVPGQIYATDNITAYYSSDITLKNNIRPIESAIFKVKQISGVRFDWNEKSSQIQQEQGHDIGLIAQEVEKVLPEIVITRENGIKAIQYEKVVPLLVEAIKEQQTMIEDLSNRLKVLEDGSTKRI